jgi:hypothetical protein
MECESTGNARGGPVSKRRREPEQAAAGDEFPRSIIFTPTATQQLFGFPYESFESPELVEIIGRLVTQGFSMVPHVSTMTYGPYVSSGGALQMSITVTWDSRKADEESIATCARQVVIKPIVGVLDQFVTMYLSKYLQPLPPAPTAATFVNPVEAWAQDMQGVDFDVFAARPV